jgi:hypothetical protein
VRDHRRPDDRRLVDRDRLDVDVGGEVGLVGVLDELRCRERGRAEQERGGGREGSDEKASWHAASVPAGCLPHQAPKGYGACAYGVNLTVITSPSAIT